MELFLIYLFAYILGSMLTGILIGSLFKKKDIRVIGSGNPGARNAGRLYGKKAFILTFLGDALKGAVVVAVSSFFQLSEFETLLAFFFTILGHIKPIFHKFSGGKGVSTFIGGMIAFEPFMTVVIILGFVLLYPLFRSFTLGGLGAFLLIPISAFFIFGYSLKETGLMVLITMIVILAHQKDILAHQKK
jgi:acyl phosphate:glycerol-3-phosphate acyltransferase